MRPLVHRCESCGGTADVKLRDGSTWCISCHCAALNQGYDREPDRMIKERSFVRSFVRTFVLAFVVSVGASLVLFVADVGGWLRGIVAILVAVVAAIYLSKELP